MNLKIERIEKDLWESQDMGAFAHQAVFGEITPPGFERIDYALLGINLEKMEAVAYMTLREIDRDAVYMKHGGAFEPIKGGIFSYPIYLKFIEYLRERYSHVTTLVENTNVTYLKFALKAGFKVTGFRTHRGLSLLELSWER